MASFLDQNFPDEEEEEDDFNPQAEVGSEDGDDEKQELNDSEAEEDRPPARRSRSRSRQADSDGVKNESEEESGVVGFGKDAEDEDEDEEEAPRRRRSDNESENEDEEDSDEDIDGQPSRKRRKQHRRNQFIDVEAEVDEEDEEEPEEDEEMAADEMHPDDMQELDPGADRDDRMHRELDRQRDRVADLDAEAQAARYKERYGRQQRPTAAAAGAIIPQRLLMPGTEDPRIWRLKCRTKKEREIINSINERIATRANSREPIQILSAFCREGVMEGNLYVEAWKQDDIMSALDGISNIFLGTKPIMIPLEEMPDLLRVKKTKQLEAGMYVRIKRGLYQGDLAQVYDVDTNGTEVDLRIVPRLDYGQNEDVNAPVEIDAGGKRKRLPGVSKQRPPPRLFSETEARKKHSKYLQRQGGLSGNDWIYQNKTYISGYLMDTFRINALETDNVNPTLEEVSKFAMEGEDGASLDLQKLQASIAGVASDYLPGDDVELFKGEQKGVFGRAVEVYGDVVKMRVDSKGPLRGQTIEAPVKDLRKLFREGDHIKVIGGQYINEVGMVVQVNRKDVTILTDSNQQEIKVFPKDLRVATDSGGNVTGSKYSLFDLVQLDASTVACVIKVDRESLRIMDQTGSVRPILPSAISNKIESKRQSAVATDRNGNEMKVDDVIKEFGGEQKQGRVLHLHRNFVFAQNRERAENAGVFVARHANVVTVAAKGGRLSNQNGIDLTKMNPAMKQNGAPGGGPMPPPQQKGRDRLIGKTVKIKVGQQKGMLGIVKDAGDTSAKVELHGKNKQISISKDSLMAVDPRTGQPLPDNRQPPGMAGRTPVPGNYGRTPFGAGGVGGRTPAYAMAAGGGRTPAWKQDVGARTPAYGGGTAYGGGFGGATAYGGATSYGGGSVWGGNQSTWNPNPSSRTPLPNAGNKTPAYSGGLEAPTPGFNSAPTPGNYGDQPTPGGFRESGQYRTPAAYQTPGGFPETPGAGYDEDGPKYD